MEAVESRLSDFKAGREVEEFPDPSLAAAEETTTINVAVPQRKVGFIIGKGGETIRDLQERSGARVSVVQDVSGTAIERKVTISGTKEKVERAKQMVNDLVAGNVRIAPNCRMLDVDPNQVQAKLRLLS